MTSAGLEQVAAFGDFADGGRSIEIYEVPDRLPQLRSTVRTQVATVAGAPEAWLPLIASGLVAPGDSTVSLGEPGWSGDATVVTDTNQRRERAFGRVEEPLSTVLEADEPYRLKRSVPDYPVTPGSEQVVARYEDGVSVRASSSQGYADAYGSVVPQAGPQAAFDGDDQTRWVSSLAGKAREQWLRVEFPKPRAVREVSVLPVMDDLAMAPIRRLSIRTAGETISLDTNPTGATVKAELSGEPVDWVEVRVVAASTLNERNQLAISEVGIDGHPLRRVLLLPEPLDPGDSLLLTGDAGTRACRATGSLPDCSTARIRAGEEPAGMQRAVEVSARHRAAVRGTRGGPGVEVDRAAAGTLPVRAAGRCDVDLRRRPAGRQQVRLRRPCRHPVDERAERPAAHPVLQVGGRASHHGRTPPAGAVGQPGLHARRPREVAAGSSASRSPVS